MSSDAELIRQGFELIEQGDIPGLLELMDPAIEWYPPGQGTLDRVYRGPDGVRKLFDQLFEAWEKIEHKPIKLVEGGPKTVVVTHVKLHGRGSGLELDEIWAYVVDVRDGKFANVEMYTDPEEAVKAHSSDVLASAPPWPD